MEKTYKLVLFINLLSSFTIISLKSVDIVINLDKYQDCNSNNQSSAVALHNKLYKAVKAENFLEVEALRMQGADLNCSGALTEDPKNNLIIKTLSRLYAHVNNYTTYKKPTRLYDATEYYNKELYYAFINNKLLDSVLALNKGAQLEILKPLIVKNKDFSRKLFIELIVYYYSLYDKDQLDKEGWLNWAVEYGLVDVTKALIERARVNINFPDPHTGDTPLHRAVTYSQSILVNYLIAYGADYSKMNYRQETPGYLARKYGQRYAVFDEALACSKLNKKSIVESVGKHDFEVKKIIISNDGNIIISYALDGIVKLYYRNTKEKKDIAFDNSRVQALAISNDNKFFVVGLYSGEVQLYNLEDETIKTLYLHKESVNKILINDVDKSIVTSSWDGCIKIYSTITGRLYALDTHKDWVSDIALSSKYIVSASYDNTLKIYDPQDRFIKHSIAESEWITQVAINQDSTFVFYSLYSGKVKLYDISKQSSYDLYNHGDLVTGLVILEKPDPIVISVGHDGNLVKYDMSSCTACIKKYKKPLNSIDIKDNRVAFCSQDGNVTVYDDMLSKVVSRFKFNQTIKTITFSKSHNFLAIGCKNGAVKCLYLKDF